MPEGSRQIAVALDDQSIVKLLNHQPPLSVSQTNTGKRSRTHFSLRYSVPPDTLDSEVNELNMRRTPRGEFVVEKKEESTDNPSVLAGSKLGKPSFRGPAKEGRDTDCVLIYNAKIGKYEMQFMDLDIQVAPALKSRKVATKNSATPTIGSGSAGGHPPPVTGVHTVPNSIANSAAASPSYSLPPITSRARSVSPLHSGSSTTPGLSHSGVAPMHASTPLAPGARSKKTKNLPTRRKVTPKPKQPRDLIDIDDSPNLPVLMGVQAGPAIKTMSKEPSLPSRSASPVAVSMHDSPSRPAPSSSSSANPLAQLKTSSLLPSARVSASGSGTKSLSMATPKAATPSAVSSVAPSAVPSAVPSAAPSPARPPALPVAKKSSVPVILRSVGNRPVSKPPVAKPIEPIAVPPESKEDEDFNEFADELADDLMEESDDEDVHQPVVPIKNLGTAGGSADDDDSSEEE